MYAKSRVQPFTLRQLVRGAGALLPRATLLLLMLLVLSTTIPVLKKRTFLGSPLWKWSLLSVTITFSYAVAAILYQMPEVILNYCFRRTPSKKIFYYGLMPSGIRVLYYLILLPSWLFFFKQASTPNQQVFEYVTWTLVSLFVGSILGLVKDVLLIKWSANVIYHRFQQRIFNTGIQFLFLGALIDGFVDYEVMNPFKLDELCIGEESPTATEEESDAGMSSIIENCEVSNYIMSQPLPISYLEHVGKILVSLAHNVSSRPEDGVPDVIQLFEDKYKELGTKRCTPESLFLKIENLQDKADRLPILSALFSIPKVVLLNTASLETRITLLENLWNETNYSQYFPEYFSKIILETVLKNIVQEDAYDAKDCVDMGRTLTDSEEIVPEEPYVSFTIDGLKEYVVTAHKDCVNMGRTLRDSKEIVTTLNIVLSFVIFVIVLLVWVLTTGIANTTVLVTVATPVLALTFIFGDTAKTLFQGIIFCFATHPYDVGDRCVVDQIELEVKNINILTTTFTKIGGKEIVMYPNSALCTKAIVNLGWKPDLHDVVEVTLAPSINMVHLKQLLDNFLKTNHDEYEYKPEELVVVKEVGEKIKVAVHFTHIMSVHESSTHTLCSLKKRERRSRLMAAIKQIVDHSEQANLK